MLQINQVNNDNNNISNHLGRDLGRWLRQKIYPLIEEKTLHAYNYYLHYEKYNYASNSIFHQKPVKFPDLENTMNFWISRVSAQGLIITDKVVKKQKYLLKN
ncbi:5632_t:CDS:2 [Entrophospora sp. SA101]|nr:5632_t:CDS:2 [Entrophospora sp. SA101]